LENNDLDNLISKKGIENQQEPNIQSNIHVKKISSENNLQVLEDLSEIETEINKIFPKNNQTNIENFLTNITNKKIIASSNDIMRIDKSYIQDDGNNIKHIEAKILYEKLLSKEKIDKITDSNITKIKNYEKKKDNQLNKNDFLKEIDKSEEKEAQDEIEIEKSKESNIYKIKNGKIYNLKSIVYNLKSIVYN